MTRGRHGRSRICVSLACGGDDRRCDQGTCVERSESIFKSCTLWDVTHVYASSSSRQQCPLMHQIPGGSWQGGQLAARQRLDQLDQPLERLSARFHHQHRKHAGKTTSSSGQPLCAWRSAKACCSVASWKPHPAWRRETVYASRARERRDPSDRPRLGGLRSRRVSFCSRRKSRGQRSARRSLSAGCRPVCESVMCAARF
jgi:hypothetical protein